MRGRVELRYNLWRVESPFYAKDSWGYIDYDEKSQAELHPFLLWARRDGPQVDYPAEPPVVIPDKPPRPFPYDFLVFSHNWLASPSLQHFIKQQLGDAIEFYPIRASGPYAHLLQGYRMSHCVKPWDILSKHPLQPGDKTIRAFRVGNIIPELITNDMILGHTMYEHEWLIRNDLKLKIKKAGFTGFDITQRPWMPGILQPDIHKRVRNVKKPE